MVDSRSNYKTKIPEKDLEVKRGTSLDKEFNSIRIIPNEARHMFNGEVESINIQ